MASFLARFFVIVVYAVLFVHQQVLAQTGYPAKYTKAMELLKQKQFEAAEKNFKDVYENKSREDLKPSVLYYQAWCLYATGKYKDASYLLYQLLEKYPDWPLQEKAWLLKASAQFEFKMWLDALITLKRADRNVTETKKEEIKCRYLSTLNSLDTLEMLKVRFPEDAIVKQLLNRFHPQKDNKKLRVAMLLPFKTSFKNNGLINEFYAGVLLAKDSLVKSGRTVEIISINTDKEETFEKGLPAENELEKADLVFGPLYKHQQAAAGKFARKNRTPVINPVLDINLNEDNPYYYLLEPDLVTRTQSVAEYAFHHLQLKKGVVIYGPETKDSLLAYYYKAAFERLGGRIVAFKKFQVNTSVYIKQVFQKVKPDSIGHVFAPTSESSVAANIFSALETSLLDQTSIYKDLKMDETKEKKKRINLSDIPIFCTQAWLDFQSINYEQFKLHNTHFVLTEYLPGDTVLDESFHHKYLQKMNIPPTYYAYLGYGSLLYFADMLSKSSVPYGYQPSGPLPGFNFRKSGDNGICPIYTIQENRLVWVNKPENTQK